MADPHGTGEVRRNALSWAGVSSVKAQTSISLFNMAYIPGCFQCLNVERVLPESPAPSLEGERCLLAMEVASTF